MDDYDEQYRPISPLGYIGYEILFAIPILGLILAIVFSFASKNQNVRNFSRAQIIAILLGIFLMIILTIVAMLMGATPDELTQALKQAQNA